MSDADIFQYIGERTGSTPIVFLPGWGFSGGIAHLIPLPRGTVIPRGILDPGNTVAALLAFLAREKIKKIHLHGWSMGANISLDFALAAPDKINSLTLLAIRRVWPDEEISVFAGEYRKDPIATFKKFCRRSFAGNREFLHRFKEQIMATTLKGHEPQILLDGLAYLAAHHPENTGDKLAAARFPIRQLHGGKDLVAPVTGMAKITAAQTKILPRSGHAIFLAQEYRELAELKKQRLARRFSRAAATYDAAADIQRECRRRLLAMLPKTAPASILELGCGTGGLSREITKRYPAARLTLVELSPEMISRAREGCGTKVEIVCGDAESFIADCKERFDLIISGATMHWFDDLKQAMAHCHRVLAPEGLFIASLFGPASLVNLGTALSAAGGPAPAAAGFPDRNGLKELLARNFKEPLTEEIILKRKYPSTIHLLRQLQKTGTSGSDTARLTLGMIDKMDDWFRKNIGEVNDQYQIFFISGKGKSR